MNGYSFLEAVRDELLPNTRVELKLQIEFDDKLIWQAADNCRVVITRLQLFVARIIFNPKGQSMYMSQYLKPKEWTYLRENVEVKRLTTKKR